MKVGELKKRLEGIDDDLEVVIPKRYPRMIQPEKILGYEMVSEAKVDHKFVSYIFNAVDEWRDDKPRHVESERDKVFHIK